MADSKGMEAATPAVMSRREAIIGALALAAGTLMAARPEAALAANGQALTAGGLVHTSAETSIILTPTANDQSNFLTSAVFNRWGSSGIQAQGVYGAVNSGAGAGSAGVCGKSWGSTQIGVLAENSVPGATALKVEGKVELSRSNRATITSGHSGCTVTVPSGVDPSAMILATLQGSAGTGVYLRYAKRATATTFTLKLNKAATSTVTVAWMILG